MKLSELIDEALVKAVENKEVDSSEVLWDFEGELRPLKWMSDPHLRNTALKLSGFGKTEYDAPEELKALWLRILRVEWKKRNVNASLKSD